MKTIARNLNKVSKTDLIVAGIFIVIFLWAAIKIINSLIIGGANLD